jgi:hypothetical protein
MMKGNPTLAKKNQGPVQKLVPSQEPEKEKIKVDLFHGDNEGEENVPSASPTKVGGARGVVPV